MYTSRQAYELISTQLQDPIVEWKVCKVSGTEFAVFKSDAVLLQQLAPEFGGKNFALPLPDTCPEERQRRRLLRRNERKLYRRTCDLSGQSIISFVSPDKPYPVYKRDLWFSDQYDPFAYGIDFDFSKSFAANFQVLLDTVPRYSIQQQDPMQNSDYCNCASSCKNCYWLFDSDFNEDCLFSNVLRRSKRTLDCSFCDNCENCYQCVSCKDSYQLLYSQYCIGSSSCYDCYDCSKCTFCYGCSGLQNASYCIYNKQYSREEYTKILTEWVEKSGLQKPSLIYPSLRLVQTEHTLGNNCINSKDCVLWYDLDTVETSRYCDLLSHASNCYDVSSVGEWLANAYDSVSVGLDANSIYCSSSIVLWSHHVYYSYMCFPNVSYAFGCVGMKNSSYTIFNKQYTKDEYEQLTNKIASHMVETGEWWSFFSPSLSPFGYNETVAQEYFPLDQESAIKRQYNWQSINYDPAIPANVSVLQWDAIPLNAKDCQDDIIQAIMLCEVSWRPYKITKQELDFYRSMNLPIPRQHPDVRHELRMRKRPARSLSVRLCDKTHEATLSVYDTTTTALVYSPVAYQYEVYW